MGLTFKLGTIPLAILTDASNNVGIGAAPSGSYKLEVTGTAKVSSTLLVSGALTGSAVATFTAAANPLILKSTSATTGYTEYYYNTSTLAGVIGNGGGVLSGANNSDFIIRSEADFVVATGGNNRRMTITSAGNVGIGTSSPGLNLSAQGLYGLPNTTGTQTVGIFRVQDSASNIALDMGVIQNVGTWIQSANKANSAVLPLSLNPRGGNVLIGSTSDQGSWKAQVTGNLFVRGSTATSAAFGLYIDNSSGTTTLSVRNDGLVTIPSLISTFTTANLANMWVNPADGTVIRSTASSQRFKDNIIDWDSSGLDTILALKPKTFTYKADYYKNPDVVMLGLIAEEVAEVSPFLAEYENEDRTGQVENVRYANIVVPLIKAIQEQQAIIQELNERLNKAGL